MEIYHQDQWGTVCDQDWGISDARVICRQLGYLSATHALTNAQFGRGTGPVLLNNVDCYGYEARIDECNHRGLYAGDCSGSTGAGVKCAIHEESLPGRH